MMRSCYCNVREQRISAYVHIYVLSYAYFFLTWQLALHTNKVISVTLNTSTCLETKFYPYTGTLTITMISKERNIGIMLIHMYHLISAHKISESRLVFNHFFWILF